MEHKVYTKIRALWNIENEGILEGTVYVQEKIDGANLSIWKGEDGFYVWSRTQIVWTPEQKEGFRWAVEYVNNEIWTNLNALFEKIQRTYKTSDIRLYGEWLVKHTIWDYNISAYNHFYLFDIEVDWDSLSTEEVYELANMFDINRPEVFGKYKNPSEDDVRQFVWQSHIWPTGEWIVIKNPDFINKFWHKVYAKVVWEKFKEENMVTFWGMQKWDNEMKIVLKYCTDGRVRKIINKIEQNEDRDIQMEDVSRIIWMIQHDIIAEEAWNIAKIWTIDFKRLKGLLGKRWAKIAISIINNEPVSVAFEDVNNS